MASALWVVVIAGGVVSGFVGVALAGIAWQFRDVPAAMQYGMLALATTAWAFFRTSYLLSSDPTQALLLYRLSSLAAVQVPFFWLVFTLAYTGNQKWFRPRRAPVLWAYPAVFFLLTVTVGYHDLLPESAAIVTVGSITAPVVHWTAASYVSQAVGYLYMVVGYAVLVQFLVRSRNVYRKQTIAILVGSLFPLVANVFTTVGLQLHPGVDLTVVFFTLNGVVVAWALFNYDFMNVSPLAGDVLVDELPDPVLVLDESGAVVDHNPRATALVNGDPSDRHVDDVCPGAVDAGTAGETVTLDGGGGDDTSAVGDDTAAVYDPHVTPIRDQHDIERGRLLVLRDVGVQQRRLDRLEALQTATRKFIRATSESDVADTAVTFAETVLDQEVAVLFAPDEDGRLTSIAATGTVEANDGGDDTLTVDDGTRLYRAFERDETLVLDPVEKTPPPLSDLPLGTLLAVPLGNRGLLCVGSTRSDATYTTEDERFVGILARTAETALARVARERQLRESRTTIRRRTEQIEFFNGVLRHSIRNGMLVIDGNVDYLRDAIEADHHDHLDTISQWCNELTELTEKIRTFNETVTASEQQRLADVDLSATIRKRADALAATYDEITFDVDVDNDVHVAANELLDEVVESVVRNAVEHNDADPRVEISTDRTGDRVRVRVADNGPGIPDDIKETVFERNVTTSQTAHGFGLYFVSVVMDLYGGTVWIEDRTADGDGQHGDTDGDPGGAVVVLEFQLAEHAPLLNQN